MEKTVKLNGVDVRVKDTEHGEYLCITDLAKVLGDKTGKVIGNWFSLISTVEYLKEWELKFNPNGFNVLRFQDIRMNAGAVRFSLSAKQWIEQTNAIEIISTPGRYGGTYAHNAIALEFCAAISPAFKLGVYVDYLESKEQQGQRWLKTQAFFLRKLEDHTLEANRYARDLREDIKKLDKENK